jgi:hypothetical protein
MDYYQATDGPMGHSQVVYRPTVTLSEADMAKVSGTKRTDAKAVLESLGIAYETDLNPIECRMHYLSPGNSVEDLDSDVLAYMEVLAAHLESDDLLGRAERTAMSDALTKGHLCPVTGKGEPIGALDAKAIKRLAKVLNGREVDGGD